MMRLVDLALVALWGGAGAAGADPVWRSVAGAPSREFAHFKDAESQLFMRRGCRVS